MLVRNDTIQRQLKELNTRKSRLLEAFLHEAAIDRATYDREKDALDPGYRSFDVRAAH
jgi:hypothetical protein